REEVRRRRARRFRRSAQRIPGADRLATALGRQIALIGFMGAGKSTLGREAAARLERPYVDVDALIESREGSIPQLFEQGVFRAVEERVAREALMQEPRALIALGGGAVETPSVREALREHAVTVLVDVEVGTAWERVRGGDRPLAQDEGGFRELYARRQPLYDQVADGRASDADGVVLA